MSELKFTRQDYIKYNSMRIYIHNGKLKLKKEDFRIINDFEETDYGYKKAVVELGSDLCKIMCDIQHQLNVYLKRNRLPLQTLIYKDKVYCKTKLDDKNDISEIVIDNIWVNKEKKLFPQIWLM